RQATAMPKWRPAPTTPRVGARGRGALRRLRSLRAATKTRPRFWARALELGRASGDFNAELLHYGQGLLRAVDQGLARDVLPLLVAATDYQQIASFDAGTALCAALAGDDELARASLRRYVSSGFLGSPRGADFWAPTAFFAHTCQLI